MNNKSSVIKRILKYLKPQAAYIAFSLILAVAVTLFTLYIPVLIGNAVDYIVGPEMVDFEAISAVIIKMIICILIVVICQWLMNFVNNIISMGTAKRFRRDVFNHIQKLPVSYLDSHAHGDILSRAVTDVEQISDGLLLGFTQLFTGVLTILVVLIIMFIINPWITLGVVAFTPLSFVIARFVAKNSRNEFQKQSKARGSLTALTDEMLENLKVVKAFSYEKKACERYEAINEDLKEHSLKATFFSSLVNPSTRLINAMVYAGVAIFGSITSVGGAMTVGTVVTFLNYTGQYAKPFNEITGVIAEFQNALASAKRVFELLDEETISPDSDKAVLMDGCKAIEIRGVDFSYDGKNPIIKDMNLYVPKGKKAAIVGPTGCGKTTLINLLMRFYDTDKGDIFIDDVNIKDVPRSDLRSQYAMVLQDTWIKSDTVRNNIAYGRPDATLEEVIEAAKEASADGFIRRLKDGYDTVIEEGRNISAGEKQLICVARVMLCKPNMVILDEATSSIDSMTELRIQKDFDKIMNGRTSIVVAHRLSTIKGADMIIAMKDGQIIEIGTHEELLAKHGFYSEIYNSQFKQA